jgi:2-keto-4-pentenoate hydratase/2-oxohepta-3-ene-1,7-dioic acid hydratase in catechol pathway
MKLAHHHGRAALVVDDGIVDVERASDSRFGPDVMALYDEWDAFTEFASGVSSPTEPLDHQALGNPAPRPRQVFAIGLNYRSHAEE